MDHNAGGSNWGSAAIGTTFTDVTAVSNVSLQSGSDGTTKLLDKKNCL